MFFALGQPAALAGLLVAFAAALGVRAAVTRWLSPVSRPPAVPVFGADPRRDIDPYGAVAAVFAGTGWGRGLGEPPGHAHWRRRALVFAAGPLAVFGAAQLGFAAYVTAYPQQRLGLLLNVPSDVLRGAVAPSPGAQLMISVAVGLLSFGVLALLPVPPLDGFGLLWSTLYDAGSASGRRWLWCAEHNAGVPVLLALSVFPVHRPVLYVPIDLIGTPLMRMWA